MKVINLFEFQRPIKQNLFFPLYANVWMMSAIKDYTTLLYSILQPDNLTPYRFFSMYGIDTIQGTTKTSMVEKNTIAEVVATAQTFAFIDSVLYVHFQDNKSPYYFADGEIVINAFTGYYTSTNDKELEAFGGLYDPRLQTFPMYRSQLDSFSSGKQAIDGGSVIIDNSDGELDNFAFGRDPITKDEVLPKIGWYGRIRQAVVEDTETPTDSDFLIIAQGYTSKITENVQNGSGLGVQIDLKDIRGALDKDIPLYNVDATDWTLMAAKDIENPPFLPLTYGKLTRIPTFCLNETRTSGNFKFLIADATNYNLTSIDKVYISDRETSLTPTILYTTQTDGRKVAYFEVDPALFVVCTDIVAPSYDYRGQTEVSIDLQGYDDTGLIGNSLDIVKDIILKTYDELYNTENYDTTAWENATINAPSIGLYIDKLIAINKVIEDIQKSYPLTTFSINTNQKYSWNDYLWNDSDIIFEILPDAIPYNYTPTPNVNADEIGAKIQINYDKRNKLDQYINLVDTTNVQNAFDKYNTDRTFPEDYNTLINNSTDATAALERLKTVFIYPTTTFSFKIPMQYKSMGIYAYELKAGDFIKYLANTPNKVLYGYLGCIISEIKQDIKTMMLDITIEVRYNSGLTYKQPVIINNIFDGKYLGDGAFIFGGIQ